jgi:hypothetical protein
MTSSSVSRRDIIAGIAGIGVAAAMIGSGLPSLPKLASRRSALLTRIE